jgi:hypothetical protein
VKAWKAMIVLDPGFSAMGIMVSNHYSANDYGGKKDSTPLQDYPEPFRMFTRNVANHAYIIPNVIQIW